MESKKPAGLPEAELFAGFLSAELGHLYQAIPFDQLAAKIPPPKGELSGKGRKAFFEVRGGLALQMLKAYYKFSDAKLIQDLNANWQMQLFCHVQLKAKQRIRDTGIVSRWRCYLGRHLDIGALQLICARHWKPWLQHPGMGFCDATVFESSIAYPTDTGLLWKSCCDVYAFIQKLRKRRGLRKSRIRHEKRKAKYLAFALLKKKSHCKSKAVCKWLLHYLESLLKALQHLRQNYVHAALTSLQQTRLQTIETVKGQMEQFYIKGEGRAQHRIVSLAKPYVRAIVRGKQAKSVEFGCKVQMLQAGGINFIEHLSYDNFNEGTRLKSTIALHTSYFGSCSQMGADRIYATNENRRYCTENHIATSFIPKGKQGKEAEQKACMRSVLCRLRGTRMEGSFGCAKNHYTLDKVKARNMATEKVWIFCSLLTQNAVLIARRMQAEAENKQVA